MRGHFTKQELLLHFTTFTTLILFKQCSVIGWYHHSWLWPR